MPGGHPQVDLEPYKNQIVALVLQKTPIKVILAVLGYQSVI